MLSTSQEYVVWEIFEQTLIEDTEKDITSSEDAIATCNVKLDKIAAGKYNLAEAVLEAENAISECKFRIEKLTADVAVLKSTLDAAETEYKALLN